MRKRFAATLRVAVLCVGALGVAAATSFAAAQKAAKAKGESDAPVHTTVKDIMDSVVDPSADVVWGAGGTVTDTEGFHDMSPKTADEWHDVRRAAVRLIEGANLLMTPRGAAPSGDKSETPGVELEPADIAALIKKKRKTFDAFAMALQSLGSEALRASEAKNTDALIEIGGRMEEVCESCHTTFWYPPVK